VELKPTTRFWIRLKNLARYWFSLSEAEMSVLLKTWNGQQEHQRAPVLPISASWTKWVVIDTAIWDDRAEGSIWTPTLASPAEGFFELPILSNYRAKHSISQDENPSESIRDHLWAPNHD